MDFFDVEEKGEKMILFHNDWFSEGHEEAIIHYSTKNQSFLDLTALLEHMGIQNRFFFLALHDRRLEHIDPHSEDLTETEWLMIVRECKENPWYFFREVMRVLPPGGSTPVMFRANRFNIGLLWCFFNHITTVNLAPRQIGKSFVVYALYTYLLDIGATNSMMTLYTKDDKLRTITMGHIKSIFDELPPYLNFKTKKDIANNEEITVKDVKNRLLAVIGQASPKSADKLGRGITTPIVWSDESAFTANIAITLPALLTASNAAIDSAKREGGHYGFIFTTTAGFLENRDGKYFKEKMYDTCLPFTETFYDTLNLEELRELIRRNNRARMESDGITQVKSAPIRLLLEYNHRQLGYTDEWLREKIEQSNAEGDNVKADYFMIWSKGNTASPIPPHLLEIMTNSIERDYYSKIYTQGYILRVYKPKEEFESGLQNYRGVICVDPSEGNGKDDIGLTITNAYDGSVLGCGNFNETNILVFSAWLYELWMHLSNFTLLIERRSTGSVIIDYLLDMCRLNNVDPFKRMFNWIVDGKDDDEKSVNLLSTKPAFRNEFFYNKVKQHFGFATSGKGKASRSMLYGRVFNSSIKYLAHTVKDKVLVTQLGNLEYRNERIDHPVGGHDDLVICWLLSYWFLTLAKNKSYYNLPPEYVLQGLSTTYNEVLNEEIDQDKRKEQENYKKMLTSLKEHIKQEENVHRVNYLIGRFNYIASRIEDKEFLNLNVDELKMITSDKTLQKRSPLQYKR